MSIFDLKRKFQKWRRSASRKHRGKSWLGRASSALSAPFQKLWLEFSRTRKKRQFRNLWVGLPALCVALCLVAVLVFSNLNGETLGATYRNLAISSYKEGRYEESRIYLERIYRDGDNGRDTRYFLASTLDALGETERSKALIDSLAPDEPGSPGYADAHFAKAKQAIAKRNFRSNAEADYAYWHLTACQPKFGDSANWLLLMSRFSFMVNKEEEGVKFLRMAAKRDPQRSFELGMTLLDLGQTQQAQVPLDTAKAHFETVLNRYRSEKNLTDPQAIVAMLSLGRVLSAKGDFNAAFRVLREGHALKSEAAFGPALAQVCLANYETLVREGNPDPKVLLSLLRNALEFDKNCGNAARLLANFGEVEGSDSQAQKTATEYLEGLVALGDASSPAAHLALGTRAWTENNLSKAEFHLRRAYQLDSRMAVTANNLAWVLSHQDSPKLDQALAIIMTLLGDYPERPEFRDTRGHIYMSLGQWDDALADMEFVLRSDPENAETHGALSQIYSNLEPPRPELAEKHRRIQRALRERGHLR